MAELTEAIKKRLEDDGKLESIRSLLRAEVFNYFNSKVLDDARKNGIETPKINLLIDELVMEYLKFNGHIHTLNTFTGERQHSQTCVEDVGPELEYLNSTFRGKKGEDRIPILYKIIQGILKTMSSEKHIE